MLFQSKENANDSHNFFTNIEIFLNKTPEIKPLSENLEPNKLQNINTNKFQSKNINKFQNLLLLFPTELRLIRVFRWQIC